MKIEQNTVAHVAYKIHANAPDGDLIEFADEKSPRSMLFGYNKIIPGFENNLMGVEEGETFNFMLAPSDAFGEYRPEMVVEVPKAAFMINGELREDLLYINNELSMMDSEGNPMKGKILEIKTDTVRMDFNHALSGKPLYISGRVIDVRAVVEEDLKPKNSGCCGGSCGCGSSSEENGHSHEHSEDENCQVCGNPPEMQGQGIGDCRCG